MNFSGAFKTENLFGKCIHTFSTFCPADGPGVILGNHGDVSSKQVGWF